MDCLNPFRFQHIQSGGGLGVVGPDATELRDVLAGITELMDDAVLDFRLGKYRFNCRRESSQIVRTGDENILHATVFEPIEYSSPDAITEVYTTFGMGSYILNFCYFSASSSKAHSGLYFFSRLCFVR